MQICISFFFFTLLVVCPLNASLYEGKITWVRDVLAYLRSVQLYPSRSFFISFSKLLHLILCFQTFMDHQCSHCVCPILLWLIFMKTRLYLHISSIFLLIRLMYNLESNRSLIRLIRFVSQFTSKLCNSFFISSRFNTKILFWCDSFGILNFPTKQGPSLMYQV